LICSAGVRYGNRRRNLGSLAVAYAREVKPVEGVSLQRLDFIDLTFGTAHFRSVRFQDCNFVGVDLRGTVLEDCEGGDARFHAVALDNASRMVIRGLRPGDNVVTVSHPAVGDVYAPKDVREVLQRLGAPEEREVKPPKYSDEAKVLIELLQHVARAYRRANILYETDDRLRSLFRHRFWPKLKRLLLDQGVVSEEIRSASGPRATALRLRVRVDELLTGQSTGELSPGPVAGLWRALRELK
jgi:Pentapeptide repeats (8 copies)